MTETNRIEYKRELTPELDIEKEVVAFLNYKEGGYIYIGIDKDGSTLGVKDVDDCMLRLKDRIKHNISPSAMGLFDIAEEQKDGRSIVKVTVASGIEKPYFKTKYGMTPRGAYMRVGTSAEPRNKELMRIYRDVELVESLGSGIPRILRAYGEDCFKFTDNFIRITLPVSVQDGIQSAPSRHQDGTKSAPSHHQDGTKSILELENIDKLLIFCKEDRTLIEILSYMHVSDRTKFRKKYIYPLLEAGAIRMTIPDKPNSRNQKYQLTIKGIELINTLKNNGLDIANKLQKRT